MFKHSAINVKILKVATLFYCIAFTISVQANKTKKWQQAIKDAIQNGKVYEAIVAANDNAMFDAVAKVVMPQKISQEVAIFEVDDCDKIKRRVQCHLHKGLAR